MKTLTITDAKKNLGRWLDAAARGQNIGIICGGNIIALRKVEVESTDYAQREYGATEEQIAALEEATEKRYRRLKRSGKLATVTTEQLRKILVLHPSSQAHLPPIQAPHSRPPAG